MLALVMKVDTGTTLPSEECYLDDVIDVFPDGTVFGQATLDAFDVLTLEGDVANFKEQYFNGEAGWYKLASLARITARHSGVARQGETGVYTLIEKNAV